MAGTYRITEVLENDIKFSCMISFNGKTSELYEVEIPNDVGGGSGVDLPELTAAFVASVLQKVADDDATRTGELAAEAQVVASIQVDQNGNIVL